jgi:putative glutamine amidotransferase
MIMHLLNLDNLMLKFIDMHRPLIGVTAGEIFNRDHPWAPVVYGQGYTYIDSIIRAGGTPFILPITRDEEVINDICSRIDGLLLSGGNDVSPSMYGEKARPETKDFSENRDQFEKAVLGKILADDKPVLGICRGMQFLNVYFSGSLHQHIPHDLPGSLNHEISSQEGQFDHLAHPIKLERSSKLRKILGKDSLYSNTHHHQAVKEVGGGLRIVARSEDNIVEAIESEDARFVIGIQAHPESLGHVVPEWNKLFEAFVNKSNKII